MQHSFENRVHLDCASFQNYAALKFSYDFDLAPRLYSLESNAGLSYSLSPFR